MQKKGKKLLNELAWLAWLGRGALSAAKLLAIEQALHGAVKFHGNLDESEEAALIDFFNKYSWDIQNVQRLFWVELENTIRASPWQLFTNLGFGWDCSVPPKPGESPAPIDTDSSGRGGDPAEILGESIKISRVFLRESAQIYGGGESMSDMPERSLTMNVKFDNHLYGTDKTYSNDVYWIESGRTELGKIQRQGDPFTYEDNYDGTWRVVSAPSTKKLSIGATIPDPALPVDDNIEDTGQIRDWGTPQQAEDEGRISCGKTFDELKSAALVKKARILSGVALGTVDGMGLRALNYIGWDGSRSQFENWSDVNKLASRRKFARFLTRPSANIEKYIRGGRDGGCKNRLATVILMANVLIENSIAAAAERVASGEDLSIINYIQIKTGKRISAAREISNIGVNTSKTGIVDLVKSKWEPIADLPPYDDLDWSNHLDGTIFKFWTDSDDRCGRRFDPSKSSVEKIQHTLGMELGKEAEMSVEEKKAERIRRAEEEKPEVVSTTAVPFIGDAEEIRGKLYGELKPCPSIFYTCRPQIYPFPVDGKSVRKFMTGVGVAANQFNGTRSAFIPTSAGRALQVKCKYKPTGKEFHQPDTLKINPLSSDDDWEIISPHIRVDPESWEGRMAYGGAQRSGDFDFEQQLNILAQKCNDDWEYETSDLLIKETMLVHALSEVLSIEND